MLTLNHLIKTGPMVTEKVHPTPYFFKKLCSV